MDHDGFLSEDVLGAFGKAAKAIGDAGISFQEFSEITAAVAQSFGAFAGAQSQNCRNRSKKTFAELERENEKKNIRGAMKRFKGRR